MWAKKILAALNPAPSGGHSPGVMTRNSSQGIDVVDRSGGDGKPAGSGAGKAAEESEYRALLGAVAAGDRMASRDLYLRMHSSLHGFLMRLVRNPGMAEELVNDVMMVVWKQAHRFRGDSKARTWVMGIAYRKGLKALKKSSRWTRRAVALDDSEHAGLADDAARIEAQQFLALGLARLTPPQRMVLELAYFAGYSCAEIAEIADCPVNTVKTRMFHARKRLKDILPTLEKAGATAEADGARGTER